MKMSLALLLLFISGSNRGSSRFINKKLLIFISLIERIIVKASAFFVSLSCMVLDCLIVAEKLKVCLVRKSCDSLLIGRIHMKSFVCF